MKYRYKLARPWSYNVEGIFEDYAISVTDKEIKNKYGLVERIFSTLGLNNKILKEKNRIYFGTLDAFYKTFETFQDINPISKNEVDVVEINAKNRDRAISKLKSFNSELDQNISSILNKDKYHLKFKWM